MELIGSSSNAHHDASKEELTKEEVFINHAEIAWYQTRREWVGDQSERSHRPPKDSVLSLTASCEDMLLPKEPFQPPIPLAIDAIASTLMTPTL